MAFYTGKVPKVADNNRNKPKLAPRGADAPECYRLLKLLVCMYHNK